MSMALELVDTHYGGVEAGDLEQAVGPFADDLVAEIPTGRLEGLEQFRGMVQAFITAFPDLRIVRRNTWQDGDDVVVEASFTGTQSGPLATPDGQLPPSGRAVAFELIDVFVVRAGKIVEHRGYWDNAAFFAQLGLLPAGAGS